MIYFDHNATSPYSPSVREYLKIGMLDDWQNPSSVYPQAQILEQKIRECGQFMADYLNCSPKHLFWTSGGTESINTALSLETLKLNRLSWVITSPIEHKATLNKMKRLYEEYSKNKITPKTEQIIEAQSLFGNDKKQPKANQSLFQQKNIQKTALADFVKISPQGEIDLNDFEKLCQRRPGSFVSLLSSNNETGVITDIKTISKIAKKYNCLVHVDAVQSLGKELVDLEDWDVDFASFSGHKIGAMKGVGLLYAKKPFASLMFGGGQERGMRPGTYNFPGIYSFKQAVRDIDLSKQKYVRQLRDYFEKRFKSLFYGCETLKDMGLSGSKSFNNTQGPFLKVNCDKANRLPNTSNIYCGAGASNQAALLHLARKGICVSLGSACNTGSPEPSHVMTHLALCNGESFFEDYANACLRVSFAPSNTKEEVDFLIQSLREFYSNKNLFKVQIGQRRL